MPKTDVSESIRNTQVTRKPFEDTVRKLLQTPPAPKKVISAKIRAERRQQIKTGQDRPDPSE